MSKLINEVSELTGMSAYNLRFYEEEGLLSPQRTGASHYRVYSDDDIKRIIRIQLYRELGISVKEMKTLLDSPIEKRAEVLDEVIRISNDKITRMKYIKSLAEFLKFYVTNHTHEEQEHKQDNKNAEYQIHKNQDQTEKVRGAEFESDYENDYEQLVLILGKQIHEFRQYYEELADRDNNLEHNS